MHFVLGIDDAYDVAPALGRAVLMALGLFLSRLWSVRTRRRSGFPSLTD